MDFGLSNRVALVAAGSQGIGFAAARELAREGARVFLCARDEAGARAAAERITDETGTRCVGVRADVTSDADVALFVAQAQEQAGQVDILVTNAGGPAAATFDTATLEHYRQAFELNALSAIRLAQLVVPGMRARRWGRVVNVTSVSVKQPIEGLLLSNSVRAGLTGWAKALSTEVAADGVTVNNVAPGWTLTEHQREVAAARGRAQAKTADEMIATWAAQIPAGRLADPVEIGAAVAFLASERAAYITGVTLQVDGGWVRGLF
ncbi:MAG TPA: SDR family oxidoreductase [Pyrinomonadaceae bacterium]|jgi:3-oxoacyl-[acyl-carrier protein] reductase